MTRNHIRSAALIAALGLGACQDRLTVDNPNSGDTKKVLGTATDAENLVGGYFKRWSAGVYGSVSGIEGMTSVMSMMNYSSLANNCLNARLPFAGVLNGNAPGNVCTGDQDKLYSVLSEVERVASSFLGQVNGGLDLQTNNRKTRDQAFGEFLRGISIGYMAMFHDSLAVVSPAMDAQDAGKLIGYRAAMDSADAALARAIVYANASADASDGGFPIPPAWMPSAQSFSKAEFIKIVRSYRARFDANVARTPAERTAAPWASIIADAQNGITVDHTITTSSATTTNSGIVNGWRSQYDAAGLWHQMPPFIIGMADVSGSYATWIATPLGQRGTGNNGFFMVTPDTRFPQGATRAAQQADFSNTSCATAGSVCKRYFVNRPSGNDQYAGAGWGWSNYDIARFHPWRTGSSQIADVVYFSKAEINMLQAEGLYNTGNFAGAAALINITRTANGLPAIIVFDNVTPVPGGAACVPKVPAAPFVGTGGQSNTIVCGTMFEALKYEKRVETAYTAMSNWYLDMRGWGDLAKDTPLYWATPNEDLLARGYSAAGFYDVGNGVGTPAGSFAVASTYGW